MYREQVGEAVGEPLPPWPLCIISGSVGALRLAGSEEGARPKAMFWNQRIWELIDFLEVISARGCDLRHLQDPGR